MYIDDIKLFAKNNEKEQKTVYRNGICQRKMCHPYNEKSRKTNKGRNRTARSKNAWRKVKQQVLGKIGCGPAEMKEKIKEYFRRTRKLLETFLSRKNLVKAIKTWVVPLVGTLDDSENGQGRN